MPKTKKEFWNVFYGNYKNFCDDFYCIIIFFLISNNTLTVLHIIDNIELKLNFAHLKSQIKSQSQYLSKKDHN